MSSMGHSNEVEDLLAQNSRLTDEKESFRLIGLDLTKERDTLHAEVEKLKKERDAAIAHDVQPYPTAWAYEKSCEVNRKKDAEIERLRGALNGLIKGIKYWGSQEDGIPDYIDKDFKFATAPQRCQA